MVHEAHFAQQGPKAVLLNLGYHTLQSPGELYDCLTPPQNPKVFKVDTLLITLYWLVHFSLDTLPQSFLIPKTHHLPLYASTILAQESGPVQWLHLVAASGNCLTARDQLQKWGMFLILTLAFLFQIMIRCLEEYGWMDLNLSLQAKSEDIFVPKEENGRPILWTWVGKGMHSFKTNLGISLGTLHYPLVSLSWVICCFGFWVKNWPTRLHDSRDFMRFGDRFIVGT